jgi:tetratricopeptide (TPR) repeat protein
MDQTLSDLRKLIEGQDFQSIDEANAFIQQLLRDNQGRVPHPEPTTPLERAMEVVYAAEKESSPRRRAALARQALDLSPDCAAAYGLLAETETDPEQQLKWLEQGVAAGERAIGEANFREWESEGLFWGITETRPYMRALAGVAELSWVLHGERDRAVAIYQQMLVLNPHDNQGIRYSLATALVEANTPDSRQALQELLRQYPDDAAANWAYNRALMLFQDAGRATVESDRALEQAIKANRHVPALLLGRKHMPDQMPQYIGFGDENEAVEYSAYAGLAWNRTPGALEWLRLQSKS